MRHHSGEYERKVPSSCMHGRKVVKTCARAFFHPRSHAELQTPLEKWTFTVQASSETALFLDFFLANSSSSRFVQGEKSPYSYFFFFLFPTFHRGRTAITQQPPPPPPTTTTTQKTNWGDEQELILLRSKSLAEKSRKRQKRGSETLKDFLQNFFIPIDLQRIRKRRGKWGANVSRDFFFQHGLGWVGGMDVCLP